MNRLERKLKELNPNLFGKLGETKEIVKLFLNQYIKNFNDYTDHSIHHTEKVFEIVSEILTNEEIENLNDDEIYILSMASYLHDIGMCIPEEKIREIADTEELVKERELHPEISREKYLRDHHHTLSKKFILEEWKSLKIPTEKYAEAIALVSEGHRIVDIGNPDIYNPKYTVKSGRDFVCLPYLSAILRIADELDITNVRTPALLTKYYMPDNDKSIIEWNKHIANTLMFITENFVEFEITCSNHSMLAALEDQFNKIANVINYCQKVIRNISNTEQRSFSLKLEQIKNKIKYENFDPKGIKYSFDVDNVINAFVGENLYNDKLTSLRELLQNSIDTCRYKKVLNPSYVPEIKLYIEKDKIKIEDNGLGMDEFIIKNYFGKLCSSFYQQENVKKDYDAIGQFGVGVFSYFLMADYIDIETKTEKSEALHFRLDKDPKNYFHFFKKSERTFSGTSITLNLKREYDKFTDIDYISYIKDKFRYIEFPIIIYSNNEIIKITAEEYEEKKLKERINDALKHQNKGFSDKIEIFTYNYSKNNYEGAISFFYLKEYSFNKIYHLMNSNFFKSRGRGSIVNISQKGVLINNEDDFINYPDIYLNINLKEKVDIQISRNSFSDNTQIQKILNEILNDFSISFFEKLNKENSPETLTRISYNFIEKNYINFEKEIYSKFFLNLNDFENVYRFITVQQFLDKNLNSFIISYNNDNTILLNSKVSANIIEYYLENNDIDFYKIDGIIALFTKNGYVPVLVKMDDFYYLEMINSIEKPKLMSFMLSYEFMNTKNIETINFDIDELLWHRNELQKDFYKTELNENHPFVQAILAYDESDLNQSTKELINEIFYLISSIDDEEEEKEKEFNLIKELEKELKRTIKIDYELGLTDFA
ncbi:ATP-binding protein [Flavobacterium sp. MC2016-06]|uniref:HD domain-containing protein n=1 Tax=Flavobacterium sp. MC2016-06 TaxID=2676308 RepID=UPI0012BAEB11|nr:ATP-binding protein [Flavobacterium sp. MC2016-06]MBU3859327.1 ATP-binding protein [Flavobacterium sp. MC2016-06]